MLIVLSDITYSAAGHVLWIVDSRVRANLRDNIPRDAMMCEVRGMERV